MAKKKPDYRNPKWLAKSFEEMSEIAAEPPRAPFYANIRKELLAECELPVKRNKLQSVYGYILRSLSTLAWEITTSGAIAVYRGDPTGWNEIRRGFLYDAWAARFRHGFIIRDNSYDENRNPTSAAIFEGKEALTLCHAIATGDDAFARGFGNHLIGNFRKTNGGDKLYFYSSPFFPFVLKLYSVWVKEDISFRPDVENPLGRYQQIFDHWHSAADLESSLMDICDFHCEEAVDTGGLPAFSYHPYNIYPVEIMSIFRIRQQLGLESPRIDHPLLGSGLTSPPKAIPEIEDPLLDRATRRFRKDFPEGIGW